jgi:hypothetical protein
MPSEEDAAATKLQAIKRGKDARHEVEQGKAARKVQSMQRGKKSRKGGDKLLQRGSTAKTALLFLCAQKTHNTTRVFLGGSARQAPCSLPKKNRFLTLT